ncbi:MAG: hypothetical protein WC449_05120 [Candidatus Paceibacterota bacterium]
MKQKRIYKKYIGNIIEAYVRAVRQSRFLGETLKCNYVEVLQTNIDFNKKNVLYCYAGDVKFHKNQIMEQERTLETLKVLLTGESFFFNGEFKSDIYRAILDVVGTDYVMSEVKAVF